MGENERRGAAIERRQTGIGDRNQRMPPAIAVIRLSARRDRQVEREMGEDVADRPDRIAMAIVLTFVGWFMSIAFGYMMLVVDGARNGITISKRSLVIPGLVLTLWGALVDRVIFSLLARRMDPDVLLQRLTAQGG